ncbi:MAG: hypothetical protein HRT72_13955 [Flavobacteriales bacterium]|nr:hypothetical protein [Flavobacteriales bacterium]
MNKLFFQSLFALILLVFISSCEKQQLNKDTTSSQDVDLATAMFEDVFGVVNSAADDDSSEVKSLQVVKYKWKNDSCATVIIEINDTVNHFPATLTIDFGTEECSCKDGKKRQGKIVAVLTDRRRNAGSITTITLQDYEVDGYLVEGSKVVTNTTSDHQSSWTVEIKDGKITAPDDGGSVTWESTRTRTWIEGEDTYIGNSDCIASLDAFKECLLDDVFEVTGSSTGVNRNGVSFTVEITTSLQIEFCSDRRQITSGVVVIEPVDLKSRTVDYGSGECDNSATVTIDGETFTIASR